MKQKLFFQEREEMFKVGNLLKVDGRRPYLFITNKEYRKREVFNGDYLLVVSEMLTPKDQLHTVEVLLLGKEPFKGFVVCANLEETVQVCNKSVEEAPCVE